MNKSFLKDYQGLLLEEKQLTEQLEEWEGKAYSAKSGISDGMPRGSGISNPTERYALKLQEMKDKLALKRIEILERMEKINNAFDNHLNPLERVIMRGYYIIDKTFEQLAVDTDYSFQRVWQLHNIALKRLEKLEI